MKVVETWRGFDMPRVTLLQQSWWKFLRGIVLAVTSKPGAVISGICRLLVVTCLSTQATGLSFAQAAAMPAPAAPGSANSLYVPTMTFDVTVVHESKPDVARGFVVGGSFFGDTSSLNMTNVNATHMLSNAYGVSASKIERVPSWTERRLYNVKGKSDSAADAKLATLTRDQVRLEQQHMLQGLLAERFNLRVHWETRPGLVFNLVVAKGGPKMKAGGLLPPSEDELKDFGGNDVPEIYQHGDGKRGYEFIGHKCHIPVLAQVLGGMTSTDVIDETGLSGTYDFDLQYSQASDEQREQDPTIWPAIPDAVEDQLGLRLERAKGLIKVLVVDRFEQPTEN
jgi:uncharacterized protein (TIGR03435 family)